MGLIELFTESGMTGNKCQIRNSSDGNVWNGSTWVAYVPDDRASYEIALPEDEDSCYYRASFPVAIAPGRYTILCYDLTNDPLGNFSGNWDGTNWEQGWNTPVSEFALSGSIGKLIKDYLNAAISSRLASGTVATDIAAIKTKTDNLPDGILKNSPLNNFEFLMVNVLDHVSGAIDLDVTVERSIDGSAFAACANAVTEVANGIYKINLAASDLNGGVITFKMSATGADTRYLTVVTQS